VEVEHQGRRLECYLADPGKLADILTPKRMLLLHSTASQGAVPGESGTLSPDRNILPRGVPERRRTGYDVLAARMEEGIALIDSRLPNRLVREALLVGALPEFRNLRYMQAEPPFGGGRLDFYLEPGCYLEVKGCTLVKDGLALFPDAPTLRGARQMLELQRAKEMGYRACVLFVVGRGGAKAFRPHWEMDPAFARALQSAWRSGVEVMARSAKCRDREILLAERMAVEL